MTDRAGQRLGNYKIVRLLGQGGFADVYLGEHIHLNRLAAIKVLRTQLVDENIENFRNEARTVAYLNHASIIHVLEFGVEGTTPFLVMEYAPNGTLRQRHPRGTQVPINVVVSYVKQVTSALQYAHDQKFIHRDIKPENMLVGNNNQILLSDFGIAVLTQSARMYEGGNQESGWDPTGTVVYMAPEQIQGNTTPASDQYALAIVVYEWLTGMRPFNGSYMEVVSQQISASPASLREKVPALPSVVEDVILMAMAKDPQQRFSRIEAFASALEQAMRSSPAMSGGLSPNVPPHSYSLAPGTGATGPSPADTPIADVSTVRARSLPPSNTITSYGGSGANYSNEQLDYLSTLRVQQPGFMPPPYIATETQMSNYSPPPYEQPGQQPMYPPVPQPGQQPMYPAGQSGQQPIYTPGQSGQQPMYPAGQTGQQPMYMQPRPPEQPKTKNPLKILLIAVIVLVVLGTAGASIFVYIITRPQPSISVNSQYQANAVQTGSTGTDFRVSGHQFSSNSSITFLLDDNVVPGNPAAQSDKDGNVTSTLTVTKDWPLGDHKLTAKDASGSTTKHGIGLKIVPQGQAHTPGPSGAPPDDMSFTIKANYQASEQVSHQMTLEITGHADPNGGSVCTPGADGLEHTNNGTDNIGAYTDTYTIACTGTYKGGKLSFSETLSNEKYTYANGVVCTQPAPFVLIRLEGSFSSATSISGSYSGEGSEYSCTQGATSHYLASQGTWTGQVPQ